MSAPTQPPSKKKNRLEQWVSSSLERQRDYERERLIVDTSEQIHEAMNTHGVQQVDVARLLGCSRANVNQLLEGRRNLTLRTLADIARVLGYRVQIKLEKQ